MYIETTMGRRRPAQSQMIYLLRIVTTMRDYFELSSCYSLQPSLEFSECQYPQVLIRKLGLTCMRQQSRCRRAIC